MKAQITIFVVASIAAISGCSTNQAVTSHDVQTTQPSSVADTKPAPSSGEAMLQQALNEQALKKAGIAPDTTQAAIFIKWMHRFREDPELKAAFPAGLPNPLAPRGALVIADGMSRITPAQRAEFWALYARVADAHLPPDCYGERDPSAIAHRLITFPNLTDSDTDDYLGLLFAALHASIRHDPRHVPTPAEHQAAIVALGKILTADVKTQADAERLARMMVNRTSASVEDACWVAKASINGINQLDPADKEAMLAQSLDQAAVAASQKLSGSGAGLDAPKFAP